MQLWNSATKSLKWILGIFAFGLLVAQLAQAQGVPFRQSTADYLGTSISRGKVTVPAGYNQYLGSNNPTILYDQDEPNPNRRFKMWWCSSYGYGEPDLPPANLGATDRIYYSESPDGGRWSTPRVVLKGQGGSGGYDAADDHLVGAPSVLKLNGKYYMFYEAYGTWVTTIDRFYSPTRVDNWVTGALSRSKDWEGSYRFERALGFAPIFPKAGTHPIYSGEVTYGFGRRNINRFLTTSPVPARTDEHGSRWRPLNVGALPNQGDPVFYLYDNPGPGRKALYSCFDPAWSNTFVTDDPNFEGRVLVELLGYAPADVASPDMVGANQNRVCLATSTDGITWMRVRGAARGGAMVAPQVEVTNEYPNPCDSNPDTRWWDLAGLAYGSGYPGALVRDDYLELYFTDDSVASDGAHYPPGTCSRALNNWRIRIPVSQIENPDAYVQALRQPLLYGYGGDIKWSPMFKRYFITWIGGICCASATDPNFRQWPVLVWSDYNPDPQIPPQLPNDNPNNRISPLPTSRGNNNEGRFGSWGGIIGDGLGHTLENASYSALHFYYPAMNLPFPQNGQPAFFFDLDHILIFLYPNLAKITVPAVSGAVGQTVTLSAKMIDANSGANLDGRMLTFLVDGTAVGSAKTNTEGVAAINFRLPGNAGVGDKPVSVLFDGDETYLAARGDNILSIGKAATSLTVAPLFGKIGQRVALSANLTENAKNSPVAGKVLNFKVNGGSAGAATTDAQGRASLAFTLPSGLGSGNKTIAVEFAGDGQFLPCAGTGTLSVTKADAVVGVTAASGEIGKTVALSASLRDAASNTPLAGRTITFKVSGAVAGTARTDSNGVASLAYLVPKGLSKGKNDVTAEFAEDGDYNAAAGTGTLNIIRGTNAAKFLRQSVPNSMVAGQHYTVTVTMQNTGETGWRQANNYRLGSQNPRDNTTWGFSRVELPAPVAPNGTVTFTFTVTAPTARGSYNFQWQMVQDGVEWFGESAANVVVNVR